VGKCFSLLFSPIKFSTKSVTKRETNLHILENCSRAVCLCLDAYFGNGNGNDDDDDSNVPNVLSKVPITKFTPPFHSHPMTIQ